jgi:enolase
MEEIIKDVGEPGKLSIGIDCNANNYYNESTNKYEMDGFKQPSDVDPLIDYYLKYITDHPLITYLEDPIADSDLIGWNKLYTKFESKNIIISSKIMIHEDISILKNVILFNSANGN